MAYDRFMIAPEGFTVGLETDRRPWLIPDEAFAQLNNAYVFRGRVRKRFGSYFMGSGRQLSSRLRIDVGTTNGSGTLSVTVPGAVFEPGQMFSIGMQIFTVYQTGTPAAMLKTGSATVATYNTSTGALVINGADANTDVYFYPAQPVMGLTQYEVGGINNWASYAFDTQFAYTFTGGAWTRSGTVVWHGDNDDFFWASNWTGVTADSTTLFVTNFNATVGVPGPNDDPMYYFDGSSWTDFSASTIFLTGGDFVQTARIIVPFKNRLLLLNTIEQDAGGTTNTAYTNRCRFSHVGSPLSTNAWLEPSQTTGGQNADGGGFVDAATEEDIVSAEFIKDRLIVYFERSTWELAFTNNQLSPFLWQKINTELGSEATFSTVPFDKVILTIGNTGVHACSGSNVERIDNKIPDKIFDIIDKTTGVKRIAGIRDFYTELVYWTFPSDDKSSATDFPNRILVYNYQNGSWAFNDDTVTTWGYFNQQAGTTWNNVLGTWAQSNNSWVSGITEANFRQVIAGNQEGYVVIVDPDTSRNAPSLQITDMQPNANPAYTALTVYNHNMKPGDYVLIESAQGMTSLNNRIFQIQHVSGVSDTDTLVVNVAGTGTYSGGGTVARVSNIDILSKQWNPYVDNGRNVYLARIDFGVVKTASGEITVDYYPSSTSLSMVKQGTATGALMGNNVLETFPYPDVPLEDQQTRLWHPVYFQSDGECIQIDMYMSDVQMRNPAIALEDFQLEGLVIHTMPASYRLQ